MRPTLWSACVLVLCCARATAQDADEVLVLDPDSNLRAGFVSALQIELGELYRVSVASEPVPDRLPERIEHATQLVESKRALATVWIEPGTRSALLYVVGRRAGRALLEVVQAPDTRGLDLERMLSIKLAEILSQLRSESLHPLNPPADALKAGPPPTAAREASVWGVILLGPRFDTGLGTGWSRFGVAASLAPELAFGSVRLALGMGVDAYPSLQVRRSGSEVSLSEVSPRVFAGVSWSTPALSFAFQAGPALSVMSVRGRTPLGFERGDTLNALGLSFALSAERAFASSLALGARVELHVAERRLHFDVNDASVLDRGRLRLTLGIDLTFRTNITSH